MSGHKGQVVGYLRVSSTDQKFDRQDLGEVDRAFEEKVSGKNRERPALVEMQRYVRDGDTVRVHSMDRLARSLTDLEAIVTELTEAGVTVEFVKERLTFQPGDHDPYAVFQRQVIGAVAELERAIIRARQAEGIEKAKAKGAYKGRKVALTTDQVEAIRARAALGVPKAVLAREHGVSRQTILNALSGRGVYVDKGR